MRFFLFPFEGRNKEKQTNQETTIKKITNDKDGRLLTTPFVFRHAKALQDSLLTIFHRIEAVQEEHDKLDSNNKFLQKYIGDLMATSKITASNTRSKK